MSDAKFNLAAFDAQDESTLVIKYPADDEKRGIKQGDPTGWVWAFYGPGHPKTIELANRVSREALSELSAQRQARANGKKWKDEEQSPDQLRAQNIDNIVARIKTFATIDLGDGTLSFSPEAAKVLLLDRRKGWLLNQVVEFLKDEENFIQPSATS